eukprot:CAMPEP_0172700338 /NCGR_PEP_ID=MMETSP1074-20121228/30844_1 /TAXON_ID=2916 /ORGANISM="Ceratium fusus, Strain PA161109" /LENGTH=83 /DNA_ID=CAMNT_0013521701 /DNA_START=241 /DNA_END=492 /DNA_ORIENTATION=-
MLRMRSAELVCSPVMAVMDFSNELLQRIDSFSQRVLMAVEGSLLLAQTVVSALQLAENRIAAFQIRKAPLKLINLPPCNFQRP